MKNVENLLVSIDIHRLLLHCIRFITISLIAGRRNEMYAYFFFK